MATSDITNANAGLIGFSQYRQLRFLRPPPPTLNTGNDLHASHANLSDLILASASTNAGSNARTSPNWLVQQNPLTGRSPLNRPSLVKDAHLHPTVIAPLDLSAQILGRLANDRRRRNATSERAPSNVWFGAGGACVWFHLVQRS